VKPGDLVRIRQGSRDGKLALITVLKARDTVEVVVDGIFWRYYRRDLVVISEAR
jgi:ribosomal protein L24